MPGLRNLSIKWKVTLISLVAGGISLLVASTVFLVFDQISFRHQTVHRVATLASVIGANSTAAVAFNDEDVAQKNLSGFAAERDVLSAAIHDARGRSLAVYRRTPATPPPIDIPADSHRVRANRLCLARAIRLEGDAMGKVVICYSLRPFRLRLLRYAAFVIGVVGLSFLITWLLSLRLQAHVSEPIVRLKGVADSISRDRDFSVRAAGAGTDEIGSLVAGFNTMLDRIETGNTELREHRDRLRKLATRLTVTEEQERRRIAGGLHDSTCQLLWAARLQLGALARRGQGLTAEDLEPIETLIDDALQEARSLTFQLSPPGLYDLGLTAALRKLADDDAAEFGLDIEVLEGDGEHDVPEDSAVFLYRAVRELLLNVHKHADASKVTVTVATMPDGMRVQVADDGRGFDATALPSQDATSGFGLFSIRERLSDLGGHVEIESGAAGTTVSLSLPRAGGTLPAGLAGQ